MNLAIFLPNWIGDAVMATPALRALRKHYADSRIVGVVRPYVAGVLEGGDWFDELVITDRRSWAKGILATAWSLVQPRTDLAVLLPNSLRPGLIARLAGARRIVGYARYGRSLLGGEMIPPEREADGRLKIHSAVDAYNRLAEYVGCEPPGYELELFTTAQDESSADQVWERCNFHQYPEVVCLNSGAAFGQAKHWPVEYFVTLARELVARRGCGVLVLCGPAEREQAYRIAVDADHPAVISLGAIADQGGPRLSLGLTKACVRRGDLLVTTDSGPRHFAHAFDRPVVTIFGPTHIDWTETHHPRAVHLQRKLDCGPCQKRICPLGHHRCMKEMLPPEVVRAAESLLQGDT